MKTIIKNLKEYNRNLYNTPRDASINTLDGDILIEVSSHWQIKGEEKENSEVLARLEIYSHMITQQELDVLVESLKMIYTMYEDGNIKMKVIHNHDYLNC
jgi:hypothetical protein